MSATEDLLSDDLLPQIASAIRQVQDRVRWKPGKDLVHLERRVMNKLLESYLSDVETPGASGIEHLDMLQRRSELAEIEPQLTSAERQALDTADHRLLQYASEFLAEISEITDLAEERRERDPSVSEWWWYLDVLIHAPLILEESNIYALAENRPSYGESKP